MCPDPSKVLLTAWCQEPAACPHLLDRLSSGGGRPITLEPGFSYDEEGIPFA